MVGSTLPFLMPELTEDHVFSVLRRTWQPVANAADLPAGKIIGYKLLEVSLVVARFPACRQLRRWMLAQTASDE